MTETASTNARVAKVLNFYATRLPEADRYLVAAVALFARPVTPAAVLTVAKHEAFGGRLDGWTPGRVEAAARDRLAGLLSWHPDGTLAAHPLVRAAFRPLALGAAEVAADATLTGLPVGTIASREDALRVVEAVELLLAADQWQAADNLHRDRTSNGQVWKYLPAARLGQRAASAFVATPARRAACADRLDRGGLGFYVGAVGVYAYIGGDLVTAREYLNAAITHYRDADEPVNLAIDLQNLTDCLSHLGDIHAALQAAEQAVAAAAVAGSRGAIRDTAANRGWVLMLTGETQAAGEHFLAADRIEHADDYEGDHLYSRRGVCWAELLARTGRTGPARTLTERNRSIGARYGWTADVAGSERMLGFLELIAGDPAVGREKVSAAVATFRDGEYLVELTQTLPLLADCARAAGDLDAADRHVAEALALAGPRRLVPAQAAALTVRARIHADRTAAGDRTHLERGRDAADTAHRLAVRRRLAWHELDALDAHARLDTIAGTHRGWAERAAALRSRLIPTGLDPDPLATVERQVAAEHADGEAEPR